MPSELPPIVDSNNTTAAMAGKGSFIVGTTACFFFNFSDSNGVLFDPSDIEAEIIDSNLSVVETITAADKEAVGVYVLAWDIDQNAEPGKYTISVSYTVETSSGPVVKTFSEDFVVGETGGDFTAYRSLSTRAYLESLILNFQNIPVFDEPARLNRARTLAELSFPRWNQNAGVRIYQNNQLKESGFSVDYLRGRVTFNPPLASIDQITVSYRFRWFTDEDLDRYVEQAINQFNIFPPQSVYHLGNIPDRYLIIAIYGAAIDAIRRLVIDLSLQEPVKVFGSFERAQQIQSTLMDLKKNYEDTFKMLLEQKKFGPYPSMLSITGDVFSLPAGRSRWVRSLFKGA